MKRAAYYTETEGFEVCERCGAPIRHVTLITDDDGANHIYGSTCGQRILGNAAAEKATREAMERKTRERRNLEERARRALSPYAAELRQRQAAIRDARQAGAEPKDLLLMDYELMLWKRERGL